MSTQNINQNSPEMKTTREKAPYAYRITPAQMRLILWLQIFGILIIYGIILLPFTAFYYLGWATHNKNPDQSFFAFLINKKEDGKKN